jgi:tRNA nucleotidyltransferase (CCA-adding enzyme)
MQIYKVGGCVRDQLLGVKHNDNDYVVVGSSPEEITRLGYISVGKDFPVFINPKTGDQYALARCEKKIGKGHQGFIFDTTSVVSLAQDLKRRDITINAIAQDANGEIIDLFNGIADLNAKIIRHVSDAFIEDPLRILRVARFSAQLNFNVAPETIILMQQMVNDQELKQLSKERVYQELYKALMTSSAYKFFEVLNKVKALDYVFIYLRDVVNDIEKFNIFKKILRHINQANLELTQRLSVIYFFINQYSTSQSIDDILHQAYLSNNCKELIKILIVLLNGLKNFNQLTVEQVFNLIKSLDPLRKKSRFLNSIHLIELSVPMLYNIENISHKLNIINEIVDQYKLISYTQMPNTSNSIINNIVECKYNIITKILSKYKNLP